MKVNVKKKIVIISQTMFPAQYPRAFRATELAKEFGKEGHQVILYAVLGKYNYDTFKIDNPNLQIKDIGPMCFAKINSDDTYKISILDRILKKILRKLIDFPEIEFVFKIPKILKNESNIDYLITIGVPHSIHWGTALFKEKSKGNFPRVWVADCGDPYMGNNFSRPYFYFKNIEKWFCRKADFISIPFEGARGGYYPEFQNKIHVIPQGFNFKPFNGNAEEPQNKVITFVYAGIFYKDRRDPRLFLEYLSSLKIDFKFLVFTKSNVLLESYKCDLGNKLEVSDYIPREDLLKIMVKADFLVNIENESTLQSPSKLIDYALTGRPILSINSKELDKKKIDKFLQRNYEGQLHIENIEQYKIENVASKFLSLIELVDKI
ncbi:MAG: hypothetical protein ACTHJN_10065 [Ginsengibacter sp.]